MKFARTVVVLGSADPEMREIERVVRAQGAFVVQAELEGKPVRPGQVPDKASVDKVYRLCRDIGADCLVLVEQMGKKQGKGIWTLAIAAHADGWSLQVVDVDHHDPDQTWPEDMPLFERSSLGQICKLFEVLPTAKQRWIGALDHDLPGAIREARAGDYLDELLATYAEGASELFGGVAPDVYVRQAHETAAKLSELIPVVEGGWLPIYNFPPDPSTAGVTGEHYPLPALPLALALVGQCGLSIIRRKDGILAWRLQCALPGQVRLFEHHSGVVTGLASPNAPYGQPERGYAGAVVDPLFLRALIPWATADMVTAQAAALLDAKRA